MESAPQKKKVKWVYIFLKNSSFLLLLCSKNLLRTVEQHKTTILISYFTTRLLLSLTQLHYNVLHASELILVKASRSLVTHKRPLFESFLQIKKISILLYFSFSHYKIHYFHYCPLFLCGEILLNTRCTASQE